MIEGYKINLGGIIVLCSMYISSYLGRLVDNKLCIYLPAESFALLNSKLTAATYLMYDYAVCKKMIFLIPENSLNFFMATSMENSTAASNIVQEGPCSQSRFIDDFLDGLTLRESKSCCTDVELTSTVCDLVDGQMGVRQHIARLVFIDDQITLIQHHINEL